MERGGRICRMIYMLIFRFVVTAEDVDGQADDGYYTPKLSNVPMRRSQPKSTTIFLILLLLLCRWPTVKQLSRNERTARTRGSCSQIPNRLSDPVSSQYQQITKAELGCGSLVDKSGSEVK